MNNPKPAASARSGDAGGIDPEDQELVAKAISGDSSAFERLFVKYRQRVFSVAWRLLRDEDAALDIVQDAFIRAYQQIEGLRGEARFYPWVRRIAVNLSIDRLRHIRRGVEVSLDEHRVGVGESDETREEAAGKLVARSGNESVQQRAEFGELSDALAQALTKLSDAHRTVFLLHASEGMSYKEIADVMDCNIGTVMSRLFYARKKLQELLQPYLKEEGS